jgi:hypothetical protein
MERLTSDFALVRVGRSRLPGDLPAGLPGDLSADLPGGQIGSE